MTLVDWGKSFHSLATELFCRQRIVFHHVPKCGGTSVGRALRRAYILSQGTVTPKESHEAFTAISGRVDEKKEIGSELAFREMMLLYLLYSNVRCVSAHVPFSDIAHSIFQEKYVFATLLRDPIERFVSHYSWSHNRPDGHGYIGEEFEEFLSSDRAKALGSSYARYFCGRPNSTHVKLSASVEMAVKNLRRIDLVGFLDEMAQFQDGLRLLTGKRLKIGRENVGKTRSLIKYANEGRFGQKLLDVCAPDREIWESVQYLRQR